MINESQDGGHCECGHGFNLDFPVTGVASGVIWNENSWSDQWARQSPSGLAGFSGMPIEYIRRGWADDFWALVTEV